VGDAWQRRHGCTIRRQDRTRRQREQSVSHRFHAALESVCSPRVRGS